MPFISVDQGNSLVKLCAWAPTAAGLFEVRARASFATLHGARDAALWVREQADVRLCALVSVASPEARAALLVELKAVCRVIQPAHGLEIRCAQPASVGLDRLFAGRGALAAVGRDCIVVDAGTALTVDALLSEGMGVFLGGAIAPGPALLTRSLAQGAAQLPLVEALPGVAALGGDTISAIRSGVAIGFRGAARELVARIAEQAGLLHAPVLLTGGARAFLTDPHGVFDAPTLEFADLVHTGLRAALGAELEA